MSRETESSSTGPHGHGGGGYPPGTEPYGASSSAAESGEPSGGRPESAEGDPTDEPQTETTMTTRVRINIPGSRPIPPVVMRKPVGENAESSSEAAGDPPGPAAEAGRAAPSGSGTAGPGAGSGSGSGGTGAGRKTSDWFAPRKPPTPRSGGRTPTAPRPPVPPPAPGSGAAPGPSGGPGGAERGGEAGRPDPLPYVDSTGDAPVPEPPDQHTASGSTPAFGTAVPHGPPAAPGDGPHDTPQVPPGHPETPPQGVPAAGAAQQGGALGDSLLPPAFSLSEGASGPVPGPGGPGVSGPPAMPYGAGPAGVEGADRGSPFGPARTGHSPGPEADTLHGGLPVVPPGGGPGSPPPGPPLPQPPDGPEHTRRGDESPAPADAPPPAKGRSKLFLLAVVLIGALGITYGAGLLLNHAEVPKGTTVLGVDIGGSTKRAAVERLDSSLGDRTTAPLTLTLDGAEHTLKPSVAGLSLDTEATVRSAAGRDYNPVTVIGALFGGAREVEAEITVDDEKLQAALEELPGAGQQSQEGTVRFENGTAVAVEGRPYQGLDLDRSVALVEKAYRQRAAGGSNPPVALPTTTRQPEVSAEEVQRALEEFGEPAMSGWLWLRAGQVEVPFSEDTLSSLLSMKAVDGKLQPVIDLEKLAAAYGGAFDGVVVDAAAGQVEMTPEHAAAAMIEALREPAPPEPDKRIALVEEARGG